MPRLVVAVRVGAAAGDGLLQMRRVDTRPDRRADVHVGDGRDRDVATLRVLPLRLQEHRAVRLVPREPAADRRERGRGARGREGSAVALGRCVGELLQVERLLRRPVRLLAAVRPARGAPDREDDLDLVLERVLDERVVLAPVVRRVVRVHRMIRPRRRDRVPGQVHSEHLDVQRVQEREGGVRRGHRLHRVVDPFQHVAVRRGLRREDGGDCGDGYQGDASSSRPQVAPFRGSAACAGAPPPERSPAPSPVAAWLS